jgi:GntR family transcriptional regulator
MEEPLRVSITGRLRDLIRSDAYDIGDRLPTEPVLAKQLGVSRAILREGLNRLEGAGFISRMHGLGTFVRDKNPHLTLDLSVPRSITAMLDSLGFVPGVRSMKMSRELVFPDDVERMNVTAGSYVYRIERVRTANGQPVAYTIDIVPAWAMKQLPDRKDGGNFSLVDHLASRCGIRFAESEATLMPLHNVRSVAEKLELDPSSHIFFFETIDRDSAENPIIFSREYFTPWIFRLRVKRKT